VAHLDMGGEAQGCAFGPGSNGALVTTATE
jgi:hypothetical protein